MKEFRNTDEITKEDLEKMYNAIVKFDNYISWGKKTSTHLNYTYQLYKNQCIRRIFPNFNNLIAF